ncbi:hypothetical protein POM88_048654 [Heracleum sosnowskyi]|uniref:Uncharacterized protein n=1 Tax=Heracleum sosnowskyi TaxID=360622 RepID=A0AAD8M0W8_9APIA|nr:hypothetical protein POM88_048654 [Heracleum sosnowskyi]
MTGKGKLVWPSGASYEGNYKENLNHGKGASYEGPMGVTLMAKGSWKLNRRHGIGEQKYQNSDVYEGFWNENKHEGSGRYVWSNGSMYIGTWKAGKMCGRGV